MIGVHPGSDPANDDIGKDHEMKRGQILHHWIGLHKCKKCTINYIWTDKQSLTDQGSEDDREESDTLAPH